MPAHQCEKFPPLRINPHGCGDSGKRARVELHHKHTILQAADFGPVLALSARMTRFLWRLTGAMVLNANAYEDVERDESATIQAMAVVLMSSLAAGIGALGVSGNRATDLILISMAALAVWIAWALLTYQIGTSIIPSPHTHATPGELLRTIGFASAPGMFRVAAVIPGERAAVFAVTAVWMLAAMVVAVRQALDYTSTGRAIAVCGLGWTLALGLALVIGVWFGPALY